MKKIIYMAFKRDKVIQSKSLCMQQIFLEMQDQPEAVCRFFRIFQSHFFGYMSNKYLKKY